MDRRLWKKRWRKIYFVTHVLRLIPYVRMVGLNGSMVTGDMHEGSDIDLYLVIEPGKIFTGRFLVTVVVHLFGVRRHGNHIAGRVCLNRFATPKLLSIGPPNEYHARVFSNLIPLYSYPGMYEQYRESNTWMQGFGYDMPKHSPVISSVSMLQKIGELLINIVAPITERILKSRQKHRYATDARVQLDGSKVVISDTELCFHLAKNR